MARTQAPVANTIPGNPYPPAREIQPLNTQCIPCKRLIPTKSWHAHTIGKKHQKAVDEERRAKDKENAALSVTDINESFQHSGPVDGTDAWASGPSAGQDSWGSTVVGNNGFGGAAPRGGAGRGGDRACYGCGREGHQKRDW